MASKNKNHDVLDKILQDNTSPRGRWIKLPGGGEQWVPDSGEDMTGAEIYQRNKQIDDIEKYLRS